MVSMKGSKYRLFAVSPPGFESVTARELQALGIPGRAVPGGVDFEGGLRELYLANLWLRTSNRVLLRVAVFKVMDLDALAQRAARYPWELYLHPETSLRIRATSHGSRLYHTGAVEERVREGIGARLGQTPPPPPAGEEGGGAVVVVRLSRNQCVVSVDSSGAPLHQRGYRLDAWKAPLRENLAAGVLLASGWQPAQSLVDPFCGSGTLPIEAALLAAGMAPGRGRSFACEAWRNADAGLWAELRDSEARSVAEPSAVIIGTDKDPDAVSSAMANAERAGVAERVRVEVGEVGELTPPQGPGGWVVTNPPYGVRVGGDEASAGIYRRLGKTLKARFHGWRFAVLCPDMRSQRAMGLRMERLLHFSNGGIPVDLWAG